MMAKGKRRKRLRSPRPNLARQSFSPATLARVPIR